MVITWHVWFFPAILFLYFITFGSPYFLTFSIFINFLVAFISSVAKFLNICLKLGVYYTCVNGKYYGLPQTSSLCSASWILSRKPHQLLELKLHFTFYCLHCLLLHYLYQCLTFPDLSLLTIFLFGLCTSSNFFFPKHYVEAEFIVLLRVTFICTLMTFICTLTTFICTLTRRSFDA